MNHQQENTIKDIAQELGLSASTVSRALKDHPHINAETKKKIKAVAASMGYQYNAMAANLRNSKSNTIGLIIPRISRYYQSAVITAIQNKLHEHKYHVMICQSNEDVQLEKELVDALYASRVEGLIVSSTFHTTDFSHFDIFSNSRRPLVFFDRVPAEYAANKIYGNDYQGGYLATSHLLESGCRRIALIGGPLDCNIYRERFEGYADALKKYGIGIEEGLLCFEDLTAENAIAACRKLFNKKPFPDAIFACSDTSALAVVQFAGNMIPARLKVVGYANDPFSAIINPAITSIEQHPFEVGRQAAVMMMNLLQEKTRPKEFQHLKINVELIKRRSSGIEIPEKSHVIIPNSNVTDEHASIV
jgi:LacI family transcriptional regulator